MKILIPLAVCVGIVCALMLFNKFTSPPDASPNPLSLPEERSDEGAFNKTNGKETNIKFQSEIADGLLSKPNHPYINPALDLKPNTSNSLGYTTQASDGTAIVQNQDTITYITTQTGKDEHLVLDRIGYSLSPYTLVYADHNFSKIPDPYTGLIGLYTNKHLPEGIITSTQPHLVIIKKHSGGFLYITFNTKKPEEGKAKQDIKPLIEDIQPPKTVKAPLGGDILPPQS